MIISTLSTRDFSQKIVKIAAKELVLSRSPSSFDTLGSDSATVSAVKLAHGDMLYASAVSGTSSAAAVAAATSKSEFRCLHGPHTTCVNCLGSSGAKITGKQKCAHGPSGKCVNCLPTKSPKATGKSAGGESSSKKKKKDPYLKWMCSHGPGGKCVNCIGRGAKTPAKEAAKKEEVSTPRSVGSTASSASFASSASTASQAGIKAPEPPRFSFSGTVGGTRLGGSSVTAAASSSSSRPPVPGRPSSSRKGSTSMTPPAPPTPARQLTKFCKHPRNGMCEHCMPKKEEDEPIPERRKCVNHGPNASCIACLEWEESKKVKITAQKSGANIPAASLDFQSASSFQLYLRERAGREQRVGFCYGTVREDGVPSVEFIYEPPQTGTRDSVSLLPDEKEERVDAIAGMLGMKRIGWIFSRRRTEYVMSPNEVVKAAEFQSKYGKTFFTVTTTVTEKKQIQFEAYQVSDQAVSLFREGRYEPSSSDKTVRVNFPVKVEGTETRDIDVNFLITRVPIRSHKNPHLTVTFPVENRASPQAMSDVKIHLINSSQKPYVDRISDFHFLLYISDHFDMATDMPALVESVKNHSDVSEGYQMILNSLCGM